MTTNVREATARDLPRILEIERLAFPQPWSLDSFKRELMLPFSRIVVAAEASANGSDVAGRVPAAEPAGFLCRWLVADECHILNVAVHPEAAARRYRDGADGGGHQRSKERKHIRLVTLEVRRSNVAARSLYRKLNFEERRLRTNYYGPGEDAIVMELHLDSGHRLHQ